MDQWCSGFEPVRDAHVHVRGMETEERLLSICEAAGIQKMGLVAIQEPESGEGLPSALQMKSRHPDRFYVFAGLNHAGWLSGGEVEAPGPAEQVEVFERMGCDGIKMIEGKPTFRQKMDVPVTDPYYAQYWARVEELGLPIVWHVGDPEEFWDPAAIPGWARERDWGYGPEDVRKEDLYGEVDEVLARHPELKVTFAHFYFLSADLARAGRFLDAHPSVRFDLTPGIEMLYNISEDPDTGREFFIRYADRLVFGTDIFSDLSPQQATIRAGIVFRWLETGDTFRLPREADFLLGPPEDGIIRGMALPEEVLARIYRDNFVDQAGPEPRALDREAAIEECHRLAAIAESISGIPASQTEAARVAALLDRFKEDIGGDRP